MTDKSNRICFGWTVFVTSVVSEGVPPPPSPWVINNSDDNLSLPGRMRKERKHFDLVRGWFHVATF